MRALTISTKIKLVCCFRKVQFHAIDENCPMRGIDEIAEVETHASHAKQAFDGERRECQGHLDFIQWDVRQELKTEHANGHGWSPEIVETNVSPVVTYAVGASRCALRIKFLSNRTFRSAHE